MELLVSKEDNAVFVFDEIDKLEDYDFLYTILEDIYRKAIFLITSLRPKNISSRSTGLPVI